MRSHETGPAVSGLLPEDGGGMLLPSASSPLGVSVTAEAVSSTNAGAGKDTTAAVAVSAALQPLSLHEQLRNETTKSLSNHGTNSNRDSSVGKRRGHPAVGSKRDAPPPSSLSSASAANPVSPEQYLRLLSRHRLVDELGRLDVAWSARRAESHAAHLAERLAIDMQVKMLEEAEWQHQIKLAKRDKERAARRESNRKSMLRSELAATAATR
jgi:hypothetical protein